MNLIHDDNEKIASGGGARPLEEISVAVLEKGACVGAHNLSGAVMIPDTPKTLVPDAEKTAPLEGQVISKDVLHMAVGIPLRTDDHCRRVRTLKEKGKP